MPTKDEPTKRTKKRQKKSKPIQIQKQKQSVVIKIGKDVIKSKKTKEQKSKRRTKSSAQEQVLEQQFARVLAPQVIYPTSVSPAITPSRPNPVQNINPLQPTLLPTEPMTESQIADEDARLFAELKRTNKGNLSKEQADREQVARVRAKLAEAVAVAEPVVADLKPHMPMGEPLLAYQKKANPLAPPSQAEEVVIKQQKRGRKTKAEIEAEREIARQEEQARVDALVLQRLQEKRAEEEFGRVKVIRQTEGGFQEQTAEGDKYIRYTDRSGKTRFYKLQEPRAEEEPAIPLGQTEQYDPALSFA